jgi:hypothetical protein
MVVKGITETVVSLTIAISAVQLIGRGLQWLRDF